METHFASPTRTEPREITEKIEIVSQNPVVSGLLSSVGGMLSILDENRQVVAVNHRLLESLGIDDAGSVLGLRPGELLNCTYAYDEPAGCGTTKYCSSCGAAIAIVSTLGKDKPEERICSLKVDSGIRDEDLVLLVKSHPISINNKKFLLLFLQDVSVHEQRAALERTFFHDIGNMLTGLVESSRELVEVYPSDLAANIHDAALRLLKEASIQRYLSQNKVNSYEPVRQEVSTKKIVNYLRSFFARHPVASGKKITFTNNCQEASTCTDSYLLSRILSNMIINALEASEENRTIKFRIDRKGNQLVFLVWNRQVINKEIAPRIFQRNFTTKKEAGRGFGTYSMKLFGEEILGGRVSFSSVEGKGTTFRFSLPIE